MEDSSKIEMSGIEIINWQESMGLGFHGILDRPDGETGCLSNVTGLMTWTPLDKCPPDKVGSLVNAAKRLHEAMESPDSSIDTIRYFQEEVRRIQSGELLK